jgi:hypothetical protein
MAAIPAVVAAHQLQQSQVRAAPPLGVRVCDQCKPSSNTYSWCGSEYTGNCRRVPVLLSEYSQELESADEVVCIGSNGELKMCGSGEFMAISHVWAHEWQGVSEDGLCSRVLAMLLKIAAEFSLEWVWLDVAMVSGIPDMSVNSMNRVYTGAKVTLVCDRLLLSMHGGNAREKAFAIATSDWMTRVWTIQESMLSDNLVVLQNDHWWRAEELLESLIYAEGGTQWQSYGAIQTVLAMVKVVTSSAETILERIIPLCRERKTTKPVDLVRALYPLFSLQ